MTGWYASIYGSGMLFSFAEVCVLLANADPIAQTHESMMIRAINFGRAERLSRFGVGSLFLVIIRYLPVVKTRASKRGARCGVLPELFVLAIVLFVSGIASTYGSTGTLDDGPV